VVRAATIIAHALHSQREPIHVVEKTLMLTSGSRLRKLAVSNLVDNLINTLLSDSCDAVAALKNLFHFVEN
jgi:hypothetical protein